MKILIVHNHYQQPGGEDAVVRMEAELLRGRRQQVELYARSNGEIGGLVGALRVPVQAVWARDAVRDLERLIVSFRPDVLHVHNTWFMASPAVCWAAKRRGVAVVQTLHNYRLICPNALLLRDGAPCELCTTKRFASPGVRHRCYRNSAMQSLLVASSVAAHRAFGTWTRKIDRYIALTEFARQRFIAAGLPAERIAVKPNFVDPDPDAGRGDEPRRHALFVGRLSQEKGTATLLEAWRRLEGVPLVIAGDGPMRAEVERAARADIAFVGWQEHQEILRLMRSARVLVFPSVWYETFGCVAIEAFACGVPVIASRLGAMAEIVEDGRTGLHFTAGDAADLAAKVRWAWEHPQAMRRMGGQARGVYEAKYTAERNYERLTAIYDQAIATAQGHGF